MNTATSSCGVGFYIGNKCYYYTSNGRLSSRVKGESTELLKTGLRLLTAGVMITEIYIEENGNVDMSFSFKGSIAKHSDTNTSGDFGLIQFGPINVTHFAKIEGVSEYLDKYIEGITLPELDVVDSKSINALNGFLNNLKRIIPTGLAQNLPFGIVVYKNETLRKFFTNINLKPILNEKTLDVNVVYVDPVGGLDANSGIESSPYKSMQLAVSLASGKTIIKAKPGLYDKETSWGTVIPTASVLQIIPWGVGDVILSMHHSGLTWSLSAGTMYSATITTVSTVFDVSNLNPDNDYTGLYKVTSSALVEATPNSYYVSGTTIYVNTFDGRLPDSNIRVHANEINGNCAENGQIVYMENIKFEGGLIPLRCVIPYDNESLTILGKNCSFSYGSGDGFDISANLLSLLQNCLATSNTSDGFNYHRRLALDPPKMIEINCNARWNGRNASGTNNGSTMHDKDSIGIRVGGDYSNNQDRNIHDINGSMSWNLGCKASNSQNNKANFVSGSASDTEESFMWLDNCESSGSTYDLEAPTGKGKIYISELITGGNNVAGSDIEIYTP